MNAPRVSSLPSAFGLIAWLEHTRVSLPLKGVECRFQITGAIACVELDQIYHQNTTRPLDCTYTFPLPAGAAVYRCELHLNGRVIRAKVEEKEAARRIYAEQKAAGRRAALVETERENLFTLSLGNVQPDDVIVVRFAWFQTLDRAGEGLRLFVPTCPGIRYIPGKPLLRDSTGCGVVDDTDQVPDASRITPPRIDALHPDAAYFSIEGRLSAADVESGTVSSPSHPIYVRESGETVAVALSGRGAIPDRDFVLSWREPKAVQLTTQSWRWTEVGRTYALAQLRAPVEVKVADGYSQDFYFLVDRSGSMNGAKWQRTCQALRAFVGLLGAQDRVWITLFETDFRDFAEVPMLAPAVLTNRGFQKMESLGTAGGTELLPAVTHVLKQITKHSAERRTTVVLITDGQVGNEQEITLAFRQSPTVTVHTFGIDTAVNDAFLKSLARQQRGGCWLQTPDDDIAGTIAALGDRLRRPVLTELAARGSWEAAGKTLPDLHAQEVVTIALRGDAAVPLEITSRLPNGKEHRFALELGPIGSEAVKLLWAKERIATLLEAGNKREAIELAKEHNLICEGAAFIAWDEAEQVAVAKEELVQPAQEAFYSRAKFCMASPLPSAPISAQPEPRARLSGDRLEESAPGIMRKILRSVTSPPTVEAQLRGAFRKSGISSEAIKELLTWCESDVAATPKRVAASRAALELFTRIPRDLDVASIRTWMEESLRQALRNSAEAVEIWTNVFQRAFEGIGVLRQKLRSIKAAAAELNRFLAWALQDSALQQERLQKIEAFADSLAHLPFSMQFEVQWQAFLASTAGDAPKSAAPASNPVITTAS